MTHRIVTHRIVTHPATVHRSADTGPGHRSHAETNVRFFRWAGAVLLVQYVLMVAIKIATGLTQEIAWMSHVALLMAAVGLLLRIELLIAAAFVATGVLHTLWLGDCAAWMAAGRFPLGVTNYLAHADVWVWLSTLHHFYLLPVLLWATRRLDRWPGEALLLAVALQLVLTIASHAFLDRHLNVNYAFGVLTAIDHPLVHIANRLPGTLYLLALVSFETVFMFMPADMLGRRWVRSRT